MSQADEFVARLPADAEVDTRPARQPLSFGGLVWRLLITGLVLAAVLPALLASAAVTLPIVVIVAASESLRRGMMSNTSWRLRRARSV